MYVSRMYSLLTASPYVVCLDSGSGNPLHPEKHPKEPRRQGLAMVEALHHSPAPHQGPAHRGANAEQRREQTFLSQFDRH